MTLEYQPSSEDERDSAIQNIQAILDKKTPLNREDRKGFVVNMITLLGKKEKPPDTIESASILEAGIDGAYRHVWFEKTSDSMHYGHDPVQYAIYINDPQNGSLEEMVVGDNPIILKGFASEIDSLRNLFSAYQHGLIATLEDK